MILSESGQWVTLLHFDWEWGHRFIAQRLAQKTAEGILSHAANKGAVATQPADADRHVGRCAARTFQQLIIPCGDQIHNGIPYNPNPISHHHSLR
ncbi:hypothetical protein AwEntero_20680 [Enterobacterales bacterium]|nr:hypothetical protein AwEntero_20680 [Enterobacterales bacterium]